MSQEISLNTRIIELGRSIFDGIGSERPSALSRNFWISKIMQWSMANADFKTNLFRLVDVLPTLKSNRAIVSHLNEYLRTPARGINQGLGWAVSPSSSSLRGAVTALAVKRGIHEFASLFIAGENPSSALGALRRVRADGLCFTIDLLGEFCLSEGEAEEYLARYIEAIEVLCHRVPAWKESQPILAGHPGEQHPVCLSVKLTALYSQCGPLNFERSVAVLSERLSEIARAARRGNALIYVDAEDAANNPIIFETFMRVFGSPEFRDFPYPGIVVQAYFKNAEASIRSLLKLADTRGAPIALRLVKGAYWDYEQVVSQQNGTTFPLFTKKESSDASFEHLSRLLIDQHELCLPAIASHNIRSLSHACIYAESKGVTPAEFELQMLYGMAEPIARTFARRGYLVRLYVPLGDMFVGMGYFVRRLLENTSNESFLRHTFFDAKAISELLKEPQLHEETSPYVP